MEEDSHVVCVGNNPHVCPAITWMHTSVSLHSAGADQPLGVFFKPIDGFSALHLGFIRDAGAAGHLGVSRGVLIDPRRQKSISWTDKSDTSW